jgi:hypothetical protein
MNNEPVAWILKENPQIEGEVIPLYTHPAKTLTDEEIMELWYPLDLHDEAWVDEAVLRDFARAILKKASEK